MDLHNLGLCCTKHRGRGRGRERRGGGGGGREGWLTGGVLGVHTGLQTDSGGGGRWSGDLVVGVHHPVGQVEGGLGGGRYAQHTITLHSRGLARLEAPVIAVVQLVNKLVENCSQERCGKHVTVTGPSCQTVI